MSISIVTTLICDGCKTTLVSEPENRATHCTDTVWDVKNQAEKEGWMTLSRGRYHTPRHFCAACADKGSVAVSRSIKVKKNAG